MGSGARVRAAQERSACSTQGRRSACVEEADSDEDRWRLNPLLNYELTTIINNCLFPQYSQ